MQVGTYLGPSFGYQQQKNKINNDTDNDTDSAIEVL